MFRAWSLREWISMKYTKLLLHILMAVSVLMLAAGCGGGGGGSTPPPPPPTLISITVTSTTTTLVAGATQNLTAVGNFSDNSTQNLTTSVTWSSSNTAIATVNAQGVVTAVSPGTVTITATSGSSTGSVNITVTSATTPAVNVMPITVNGSLCSSDTSNGYLNKPCVSVTVCSPDQSVCQTVNDVLLDTGSYGLRVFRSALPGNMALTQNLSGTGGSLAECIQFADGSSVWGPVQTAAVKLGNEPAVPMAIQVIDSTFASRPAQCGAADATPSAAGFTAILGVGVFTEDCGPGCASRTNNGVYFSCTGSSCTGTMVAAANQVKNPVAQLPADNNGVILSLPNVPVLGSTSVNGSLILGIGTQANNTQSPAPTVFPTDQSALITTTFHGTTFSAANGNGGSFIDSGSNGYFIPNVDPTDLPICSGNNSAWYCPPTTETLSAMISGAGGSPSKTVNFSVANFVTLSSTSNNVFNDIAGTSTFGFDWGLPFFFGRSVSVGFEGLSALGTTGPFVAF
jgi:hypothetical protein